MRDGVLEALAGAHGGVPFLLQLQEERALGGATGGHPGGGGLGDWRMRIVGVEDQDWRCKVEDWRKNQGLEDWRTGELEDYLKHLLVV